MFCLAHHMLVTCVACAQHMFSAFINCSIALFAVFSELLSRVLGLEGDICDPVECKMCVTVFQFASFFLQYDE